jgi:hypothetical protein
MPVAFCAVLVLSWLSALAIESGVSSVVRTVVVSLYVPPRSLLPLDGRIVVTCSGAAAAVVLSVDTIVAFVLAKRIPWARAFAEHPVSRWTSTYGWRIVEATGIVSAGILFAVYLAAAVEGRPPEAHRMVTCGELDEFRDLLAENPKAGDARDWRGDSAVHVAARLQRPGFVEALVGAGADVNAADRYGRTPLHIAAIAGDAETASLLLSRGAEAEAISGLGTSPLHDAVSGGHDAVVSVLLAHGADPHARRGWDGLSALEIAKKQGFTRIAGLLEDVGRRPQ